MRLVIEPSGVFERASGDEDATVAGSRCVSAAGDTEALPMRGSAGPTLEAPQFGVYEKTQLSGAGPLHET